MSTANGGFLQGFNAQAIATEDQIIITCSVTNEGTDYGQLEPMVKQAAGNLETAGVSKTIGVVTADAGYISDDNLGLEEELEVELLIATRSHKHAEKNAQRPRGRIPKNLSKTQRMERKLRTKRETTSIVNERRRSSRCAASSDSAAWDVFADAD